MAKPCFYSYSSQPPRWWLLPYSLGQVNFVSLLVLLNIMALGSIEPARADAIPSDLALLDQSAHIERINLHKILSDSAEGKKVWPSLEQSTLTQTSTIGAGARPQDGSHLASVDASSNSLPTIELTTELSSTGDTNAEPAPIGSTSELAPVLSGSDQALGSEGVERSPTAISDALALTPTPAIQLTASPEISPETSPETSPAEADQAEPLRGSQLILGMPSIQLQGAFLQQADDASARLRLTTLYPVTPHLLFGGVVDLTTGRGFSNSPETGLNLSELYVVGSLPSLPELRVVAGLIDLTSYFDRNSFAKDSTTHFFNPAFQTNPALAAAGISTRIGVLLNWSAADNLELKLATFSSSRNLSQLDLDGLAGEIEYRIGTGIIRATYAESRDAGSDTGFDEIFQLPRDNGTFGLNSGDRETAFGLNAEWYVPSLRMGLFGRLGRYHNRSLDAGATTYSLGVNFLDLFLPDDRLGLAYGRQLSNDNLRRNSDGKLPDVLELFYDVRVLPRLRAGITLQQRNEFSETVAGFRVRTDLDISPRR